MAYEDISDYDYVCMDCGELVSATGFFCGRPEGLPDECPECNGTQFISQREYLKNVRVNAEDAAREDERLYDDQPW